MRLGRDPAIGRLTKRPDFLAAASGRRFHTERMTLQTRFRGDDEPSSGLRVGFTITKRVGHATERNRIRRRLRNAVLAAAPPFAALPVDVVVIGRRDAFAAEYGLLVADLSRGLAAAANPRPRPDRRAGRPPEPGP